MRKATLPRELLGVLLVPQDAQEERGETGVDRRHDAGEADLVPHRIDEDEGEADEVQGCEKQDSFGHERFSLSVERMSLTLRLRSYFDSEEIQKTGECSVKNFFCQDVSFEFVQNF